MMHDACHYGENGLIWSDDKDLCMTPYPYWCKEKASSYRASHSDGFNQFTPSGTMKLIGQGPLFLSAQMLMGDTADNVQGIKKLDGVVMWPCCYMDCPPTVRAT